MPSEVLVFSAIFLSCGLVSVLLSDTMTRKIKGGKGRHSSMIPNDQLKTVPVDKRPVRGAAQDISPKLERTWFKFDRNVVLHQIDKIQGTINENAKQLGMVAAEGVFEKPLSDDLLHTSRALGAIAQELAALRGLVGRTSHYPKTSKRRS